MNKIKDERMIDSTVKEITTMTVSPTKTIFMKCQFPTKETLLEIDEDISLQALKNVLSSAAGIEKKTLELYTIYSVSFQQDAVVISSWNEKGAENIGQHIPNNSTIYLAAPAGIRPIKKFCRKKKEEEDKEDTTKKKELPKKSKRFRGVTEGNCLVWLKATHRRKEFKKYNMFLEFLDGVIMKLLKTSNFLTLPKSIMLDILRRDLLVVDECQLFQAVIMWAQNRARRILKLKNQQEAIMSRCKMKENISPQRLIKIVGPLLKLIRFPIMQTQEIITKVHPMKFLTVQQIRDLCSYSAIRIEIDQTNKNPNKSVSKEKLDYANMLMKKDTIKEFSSVRRSGVHIVLWHYKNNFSYEICETHIEAKETFQSLVTSGCSRAWYSPYLILLDKWYVDAVWKDKLTEYYNQYLKNYSRGNRVRFQAKYNTSEKGPWVNYHLEFSFFRDKLFGTAFDNNIQIPITGILTEEELSWEENYSKVTNYMFNRSKCIYSYTITLKSIFDVFEKKELKGMYSSSRSKGKICITQLNLHSGGVFSDSQNIIPKLISLQNFKIRFRK